MSRRRKARRPRKSMHCANYLAVLERLECRILLTNDLFADRIDLGSVDAVTTHGTNVGFTGEPDEPGQSEPTNSAWWSWTAPASGVLIVDTNGSNFDTFLTLATGPAVDALTVLQQNDDSGFSLQSLIVASVTAGTQYHIAVDGFADDAGEITLNLSFRLPNDDFTDRIDLGSLDEVTSNGTNTGFTGEPGEPAQSGAIHSAWWSWTAPASGTLVVDTRGSRFDTFLTLATGTAVDGLTVVEQNDNTPFDDEISQIVASVTAGTQYHIAVDGFEGATGQISLNLVLNTFTNDDFAERIDLGAIASVTTIGNNAGFSGEPGEPEQSGPLNSAWWSWTAPASGQVIIDTDGSNFDTFLTLATGPAVDALTVLQQNDDGRFGLQSLIIASVTAGTQYHIAVDGFADDAGEITLSVSFIGFSFVDADNDGRFTAGTDVALVAGEVDDGFFDTQRPEGAYASAIPGAGLVLGGAPVTVGRDANYRADGNLTVYAGLTSGDDIKLTSRSENVSLILATITARDEIEITGAHDIGVSDAEIFAGDEVDLTSTGGNIDASSAVIEALGDSDGQIELNAAGDIFAFRATLRASEEVELTSTSGSVDAAFAVIEALGDSDGQIELKAAGDIFAFSATLRASEEVELTSRGGRVDADSVVIEALGDSDGRIELKAHDDIIVFSATLRASEEVELTSRGGSVFAEFVFIEALGDSDGQIELKAADDILVIGATLSARDEIELQSTDGSIDATAALFTADEVELDAALDIRYCAANVTTRDLDLEWGRLLDDAACVLPS